MNPLSMDKNGEGRGETIGEQKYVDTHAHLEATAFESDVADVVDRAGIAGVGRILAVGSDFASSERSVALAHEFDAVYAAVGAHPHHASSFHRERDQLQGLLADAKVVAIGEIGLDYARNPEDRAAQLEAFEDQLEWAEDLKLPVSVHNRDSDEDVLARIQQFRGVAILHCFTGSREFLARVLGVGCFVSIAGNVTFPNADALREIAELVPGDRLLLETDSPVLAPQSWRGRRNEPGYISATYQAVAEKRHVASEELAQLVRNNANRVFCWGYA